MSKNLLSETFKFHRDDIVRDFIYNNRLDEKFKNSFDYVLNKLKPKELKPLSEVSWYKTKNYKWCAIKNGDIVFVIRKYRFHFTVCYRLKHNSSYSHGAFTFYTNISLVDGDKYLSYEDDVYKDLDNYLPLLIKTINDKRLGLISNISVEKQIELKNVFYGTYQYQIDDLEQFLFVCDELFNIHSDLFAENEMLDKIKTLEVGQPLQGNIIDEIRTNVKDDYYHDIGLDLKHEITEHHTFCDVYRLTNYYLNDLFPEL